MSAIDDLKCIVANQKTIRTSRLARYVDAMEYKLEQQREKLYYYEKKIKHQKDELKNLNKLLKGWTQIIR